MKDLRAKGIPMAAIAVPLRATTRRIAIPRMGLSLKLITGGEKYKTRVISVTMMS